MMRKLIFLIILFSLSVQNTFSCTTFIISGKVTPDGKPILYKHRDTDNLNNALVFFRDGKYKYIGLVNSDQDWNKEVWGGYNETGFAIINSVAYNKNVGDTTKFRDQEGAIMKLALQNCKTLEDFEELLKKQPKPLGVDTNFGVIDAYGGAAYYETGNFKYVKYDVNDTTLAPEGYMVRTNHAFSGDPGKGSGYNRFNTASAVLKVASMSHNLTPAYLLDHISRNLTHLMTSTDLWEKLPVDRSNQDMRFFVDFIPRVSSSSAMLIAGAHDEKHAGGAMMWTILGFPLTSIAIPTWIAGGSVLPAIVTMNTNLHTPLCDAALQLKKDCFPFIRGEGLNYINLSAVINQQKTGYLQILQPLEQFIFDKARQINPEAGSEPEFVSSIQEFYKWLDTYLDESYNKLFHIDLINTQ
jgi:hypothetical protein